MCFAEVHSAITVLSGKTPNCDLSLRGLGGQGFTKIIWVTLINFGSSTVGRAG